MSATDFDVIEGKIKTYKELSAKLYKMQNALQENQEKLKTVRKNTVSNHGKNEELTALNEERNNLKTAISDAKKIIKESYQTAETLIFQGIKEHYSEVYENQLSRLYGYKIDVLVKQMGDLFDEETCVADTVIITRNKAQHRKILRMIEFGIRDTHNNSMERRVRVEVCAYSKKHKAGETLPFDYELIK
ncbi:MAG: hypothetical protein IKL82_06580 [Clostridia bacterium]|nr:hypothetical protein [Clostridia bacterium]